MTRGKLARVIDALESMYGRLRARVTDPFEMILLENACYLVDDARRHETFEALRRKIGTTPEAILAHSAGEIAEVIAGGGMKPEMRAEKVLDCARLAKKVGVETLRNADKKVLRKFPGVGEPYADRILLFTGRQATLAPDSNALRTLLRLGFGTETKNYAATYRSILAATTPDLPDAPTALRAHLLLRRHGQEVCKRTMPRCEVCAARRECAWYQSNARPV